LASSKGRRGLGDYREFWFALIGAMILLVVLVACSDNGKQDQDQGGSQPNQTSAPASTPTAEAPPLTNAYAIGAILRTPYGETYCLYRPQAGLEDPSSWSLNCLVHLRRGDAVEVLGDPQLLDDTCGNKDWYYPVLIWVGGLYAQDGEQWLISAHDRLILRDQVPERELPNVRVGETYLPDYNFCLHDGPGGPCRLDAMGRRVLVFSTWSVELVGQPVLAEGRYWCFIRVIGEGKQGYISCELQGTR
jgi:hypothetical protein